jgi:hypothetical protein
MLSPGIKLHVILGFLLILAVVRNELSPKGNPKLQTLNSFKRQKANKNSELGNLLAYSTCPKGCFVPFGPCLGPSSGQSRQASRWSFACIISFVSNLSLPWMKNDENIQNFLRLRLLLAQLQRLSKLMRRDSLPSGPPPSPPPLLLPSVPTFVPSFGSTPDYLVHRLRCARNKLFRLNCPVKCALNTILLNGMKNVKVLTTIYSPASCKPFCVGNAVKCPEVRETAVIVEVLKQILLQEHFLQRDNREKI